MSFIVIQKTIRVEKKNSAFVYAILESLEGMTSYRTRDRGESLPVPQPLECDIELQISADFLDTVDSVLEGMGKKFPLKQIEP